MKWERKNTMHRKLATAMVTILSDIRLLRAGVCVALLASLVPRAAAAGPLFLFSPLFYIQFI